MSVKVRFAPSPTGYLHVGNIRAALINYLYAKKNNGIFILRFDDTDLDRCKDQYKDAIIQDLEWLGIKFDKIYKQSDNLDRYQECKEILIKSNRLYECFETQQELAIQRKSQINSGQKPIYNRNALNLTQEQKDNLKKSGIKPYYRFLLDDKRISWNDKIKGNIAYEGRHFSDPVLIRENGSPTYTFCSVIDDIDNNISDIIRGEDHVTNTAIQIQIFNSLGHIAPNFAHLPLIKASQGKISKRIGGYEINSLRKNSFEPQTINNFLSQIGTSKAIEIHKNLDQIINDFNFEKFSKSSTKYDINELEIINHKVLQIIDFSDIKHRLEALITGEKILEDFYQKVKPNINFLNDITIWHKICYKKFRYNNPIQDKEFLSKIATLLPEDCSKEDSWQIWLNKIKENCDRKGKNLFLPIRMALTGKENGPEITNLINLIDRDEIIARLNS